MNKLKQAKEDFVLGLKESFNAISNDIGPLKTKAIVGIISISTVCALGYSAMILTDQSSPMVAKLFFTLFPLYSALSIGNIARKRGCSARLNKLELR